MLTIILGVNPINMSSVDRSAANILRAVIEFMPGGAVISQVLAAHGVFDKVGGWVEAQFKSLGMAAGTLKAAIDEFVASTSILKALANLGATWERAKRIFTGPIDRLIAFGKGLVTGILQIIKDAILVPIAKLAEGTSGWPLLTAVLGKNPITGDKVARNPETVVGGFMVLVGQQEM